MNITDPILFQARYQPQAPAICAPGISIVSYGTLEQIVNNIMRRALTLGVAPGQTVALFIEQGVMHAAVILAMARLGVITLSPLHAAKTLVARLPINAVIADGDHPFLALRTITFDASWVAGDGQPVVLERIPGGPEVCRLCLTSGTTGDAKAVALTHDMILGRLQKYDAAYGPQLSRVARIFCDVRFGTALGFQFMIYALGKGAAFFLRGSSVQETLRAFAFAALDAIVATPAGLRKFATDYDAYRHRHRFDLIISSGSITSKPLADLIRSRMGSNVISDYGSTEASVTATAPLQVLENAPGAVGWIGPGIKVEIVDAAHNALPPGQEGILRINGDHVAAGYAGDPDATARYFYDGWFYPGDIGRIDGDGMLAIVGREDNVLNLGGVKVRPEAVEAALNNFAGVAEAAVFSVTDAFGIGVLWAAYVSSAPIDESALRDHCAQKLSEAIRPRRFIRVDELPRNETGKLDRSILESAVNATNMRA